MADPAHPRWSLSRPSPPGGLPSLIPSWAVPPLAAVGALLVAAAWWSGSATERIAGVPFPVAWAGLSVAVLGGVLLGRRLPGSGLLPDRPSTADLQAIAAAGFGLLMVGAGIAAERWLFHGTLKASLGAGAGAGLGYLAGLVAGRWERRIDLVGASLVGGIVAAWTLQDFVLWTASRSHLYDFQVYLGSSARFLRGEPAYLTSVLHAMPPSAASDYFLYPPPLLPFFGLLSHLPQAPAALAWIGLLIVAALTALRALGAGWGMSLLLLTFPPLVKGIESGNIASLTFLLLALGPMLGMGLVANGVFKTQAGLPALWLVRERRWRAVAAGALLLTALAIATLPFVGLDSWRAWLDGLRFRADSQSQVPLLYGLSLAGQLPTVAFAALSLAAVAGALLLPGLRSLAGLGLATIVASPTLWPHGFLFAFPALAFARPGWLVWLAMGLGATGSGIWVPTLLGAVAIVLATPPGGPGPADHLRPYTARWSWLAQTAAAGPPTAADGVIP